MVLSKEVTNPVAIASFESLEKAFVDIHKNLYSYGKAVYINTMTKIEIVCKNHGSFWQTPSKHKSGHGCPQCRAGKISASKTKTTTNFIAEASKVHKGKYTYFNTVYTDAFSNVVVTCDTHGDFLQRASSHLNGRGCPKCASVNRAVSNTRSNKEFIEEASKIHKNMYTYSNTAYTKALNKVIVTCKTHGDFSIRAQSHLRGFGCPSCSTGGGFNPSKEAILYYLKINGGQAYKIGITNKSVKERFNNSELQIIEVINTWYFSSGADAKYYEEMILNSNTDHKWQKEPLLVSGNTELFTKDIRTSVSQDLFESFSIQQK